MRELLQAAVTRSEKMRRCTRYLTGLQPSLSRRRRFIPPWERDGKSVDEFFGGLMQSSNPLQRRRKEKARQEETEAAILMADPLAPEDYRRLEEMEVHNAAIAEAKRSFLPYGAAVRHYYESTNMAAWGAYEASLKPSPIAQASSSGTGSSYSAEIQDHLRADLNDKIPYRYESFVPPVPNSSAAPRWPLHGSTGMVLDIDGVIYRSGQLINGADTAIRLLSVLKIPFLFMTNGGAKSEAEKAEELSALLQCRVEPNQVLMAHSPMRLMSSAYQNRRVLIVGPPHCAAIAKSYGFNHAMSIQQYQCEHPEMLPYKKWGDLKRATPEQPVPFPEIAAIFQMNDPDDVLSDIQTLLDVLLAPFGKVGSYVSGTQTIPYYVAADDLLWATEAPLPRLGQGAFREMFSGVFESVTGNGLQTQMYGKPRAIAFAYAEQRLKAISAELGWNPHQMRSIFMVGDNIETDILGANAAGGLWTSVHVLSGVGKAPAALRTLSEGDTELEWLESCVSRVPHYVAPTLDHFIRELLAFPEEATLHHKVSYHGKPNPVDLKETYNFH